MTERDLTMKGTPLMCLPQKGDNVRACRPAADFWGSLHDHCRPSRVSHASTQLSGGILPFI